MLLSCDGVVQLPPASWESAPCCIADDGGSIGVVSTCACPVGTACGFSFVDCGDGTCAVGDGGACPIDGGDADAGL